MSDTIPPPFVGSSGADWNVRAAMLGPPDNVNQTQMQWLLVPGPPISAYLAFVFPRTDPTPMHFFHSHPATWSLHVVIAGAGKQVVEGASHDVEPGSVLYHGPGVRHSLSPLPDQPLVHIGIQHPALGWDKDRFALHPEAGTITSFEDVAAFVQKFGAVTSDDPKKTVRNERMWSSVRWKHFVHDRTAPDESK